MKYFFLVFFILFSSALCCQDIKIDKPHFNGASVIGNYPEKPIIFTVPVSGARPLNISCSNLPQGLKLDTTTGIITGNISSKGTYKLDLIAENKHGKAAHTLTIHIGESLLFTPLMGWNSWNVFEEDINEQLIIEIADAMVSSGMRDLGYQFINLDDFWHGAKRNENGAPTFDSIKFPNGIKYLADYIHSKGLKLGIYSCAGELTCGEQFGGNGYEEIDAKTYAEWGVDLLKYDYCYAPYSKNKAIDRYQKIGKALQNTDRTIVLSICEWGLRKPWKWGRSVGGHYWRITPDIFDTWEGKHIWHKSAESIIRKAIKVDKYATVDAWNDMDMLIVGNYGKGKATSNGGKYKGMNDLEYESHMKLWCLFKSPLIAGCDLRTMNEATQNILMNRDLIAINQDTLAAPVKLISRKKGVFVFERKMQDESFIYAIWNSKNKIKSYNSVKLSKKLSENGNIFIKNFNSSTYLNELPEKLDLEPHETVLMKLK